MIYNNFRDIKLSALGMGNMRLPVIDGDQKNIDYELGQKMIDRCMAAGINYYDTAYIYHGGLSEEFVGRTLVDKYPRDSFYVATKFNLGANPDYKAQLEEQLTRLHTDHIDFYLLHGIGDQTLDGYMTCGCLEYFREMKKEGKIVNLGFSFHGKPEFLRKAIELFPDTDFIQLQLNYYDWYHGTAEEQYNICAEKGIPVMVMEPVHGGLLQNLSDEAAADLKKINPDVSLASFALRFVAELPQVAVTLSGMSNFEQVEDNIRTFENLSPLSDKEKKAVIKAADITYSAVGAPCTGCRYCVDHCPMELDIPALLVMYNEYKVGGAWRLSRLNKEPSMTPASCISCGACTASCPQSLEVYNYMTEMSAELEKMKNH